MNFFNFNQELLLSTPQGIYRLDEEENNTVVLTDIVKNSENLSNFLSNSEIIVKLKQLEENVNNQQEILMHLIENLEKKNN